MSNAWNQAEDLSKKHAEQGGLFIRLPNNGDKVVGAFCGEPHAREVHWTGERYEVCFATRGEAAGGPNTEPDGDIRRPAGRP